MRGMLMLALLSVLSLACYSDGMILPPHHEDPYPVVLNHYVNITVNDTYARFYVDQEFINEGPADIQGTYTFPVPSGSIRNFQIIAGGKTIEGKLLGKEEARNLYRQYVTERGDASLLEYSGLDAFTASVYLKRGETVRVQISYEQVISESAGTYSVFYPLSPERYSTRPIDPVDIRLEIYAAGKIGFIISPTHNISVSRLSNSSAVVSYYSKEIPDRDFQVFYGVTQRDYDVKAIASKNGGEDGYFMLFVYPSPADAKAVPKDIIYVIDTSGSMQGTKLEQAKKALSYGLGSLNAGDRFSIISFSDTTGQFSGKLESSGSIASAQKFVDGLDASGTTDIQAPLELAASQFSNDSREHIVVLLTDGEDTTGHTTRSVLDSIKGCDCRIFPFGVGTQVDFELLDRLANDKGDGMPVYIRSDAELEGTLSAFYDKISKPLLHNVNISIQGDGIKSYDIYPKMISDVFYGGQIAIAGKYSGSGTGTVTVSGMAEGEEKSFDYQVAFPENDSNPFVERTWAVRKVGYLLDTIALEGETEELRTEVTFLATKYGIPSPYTSYVAAGQNGEVSKRSLGIEDAAGGWGALGNSMTASASYRSSDAYSYAPPETKDIGDKTFVSVGGVWRDTSCGNSIDQTVSFGSSDYSSLLSDDILAHYLSVGQSVLVCYKKSILVVPGANIPQPPSAGANENAPAASVPMFGNAAGAAGASTGSSSGGSPPGALSQILPLIVLFIFCIGVVVAIIIGRPQEQRTAESEGEAQLYKTLSSDTRIDILKILEDGEGGRTPSFLSERLGKSKATISEHLEKLVEAKLVEKEEAEGRKWVFYKLTPRGKSVIRKGG